MSQMPERGPMPRQKGLNLTDRDMEVLKYLAVGPAFADDLHLRFFVGRGKTISRQAFERRMWKLTDACCITRLTPFKIRGRNPIQHKPVFAIGEEGIAALISEAVMPIDRIRRVRLNRPFLFHEIIVGQFVRRVYEGEPRRYRVIRLYDHAMLAKQVQKVRVKRIPDLRFTIQLSNGSYFSYLVEIDAGTTHTPEFVQKLAAFIQLSRVLAPVNSKDPVGILIVCHTADRMTVLQRAVMESHVTVKVANKFLFNTIRNIDNSLGLLNPWYKADGSKIEMIFRDKGNSPEMRGDTGSMMS